MAVYGIGAYYGYDVSSSFISNNIIGVGWSQLDAPELHEYFRTLKTGDIVYIKSAWGGHNITVKAVGIIKDNIVVSNNLVTTGRNVKWLNKNKFTIPRPKEKNNVRSNSVYEEFHPDVLALIIDKIN